MVWKNDLSDLPDGVKPEEVLFAWKVEERLRKDPLEDLPDAYLVHKSPEALVGIVIYAKWRGHWQANPFSVRGLVRKLLSLLPKQEISVDNSVADFVSVPREHLEFIMEKACFRDEGPTGEGWQSTLMQVAVRKISDALNRDRR